MDPIATQSTLDFSPERVIPIVVFALVVVVLGAGLRKFVMAYGD
jgi:hypothetical protein